MIQIVRCLVLATMLYSCGGRPTPASISKVQEPKPTLHQRPDDPVATGALSDPKQREAWYAFTKDGRYRWARPEDFKFPGWATANTEAGRSRMLPFEGGDINHDGAFNDFALIVVDTTRQAPNRFGLVIFNDPGKNGRLYSIHWLFRDTDMSTTALSWSSDGLGVTRYAEDGYSWYCVVKWNAKKGYSCTLRKVPRRW
jgi:hypothetical protein